MKGKIEKESFYKKGYNITLIPETDEEREILDIIYQEDYHLIPDGQTWNYGKLQCIKISVLNEADYQTYKEDNK